MSEASTTPEADSLSFDDAEAASWIGRVVDGRYKISRILGEGGMGAVYEAEHLTLQKAVALKVVHSHFVGDGDVAARFAREAMASARVEHPHVASAMDFGTLPDGQTYLVMQLARGRSLGALLDTGHVAWPKACEIAAQIADALAAAHAEGIVHRDLKPDNVMLMPRDDGSELVKVLDFGIARVGDDGRGRSRPPPGMRVAGETRSRQRAAVAADMGRSLTHVGTIIGTPGYMAPEQAIGQAVDHRVDLYSLGVVLWEMVVGESLYPETDLSEIITRQFTETPKSVIEATGDTSIPGEVEGLIAHLLSRAPEDRPARASDVRDNLRQITLRASLVDGAVPEAIASSSKGVISGRGTGPGVIGSRPTFAGAETARTLHAANSAEIALMTDLRPREPLLAQVKSLPRPLLIALCVIPIGLIIGLVGLLVRLYSDEPLFPRPPQVVAGLVQKAREVAEPTVPDELEGRIETLLEAEERTARRDAAVAILAFEPATAVPAYASAAAELELGRTCNERKIALARIAATGDLRLLPALRRFDETPRRGCGFLRNRDCHGCIREDIARAILTIDPTARPFSAGN